MSEGGKRHCPSAAVRAPRSSPSELSTTVEQGTPPKSSFGRQNSHHNAAERSETASTAAIRRRLSLKTDRIPLKNISGQDYFADRSGELTLTVEDAVPAATELSYIASQLTEGRTKTPGYAAESRMENVLDEAFGRSK